MTSRLLPLLLSIASVSLFAQDCDEKIKEQAQNLGKLGYQQRGPRSRCEGLYYDKVSGVSIDLVSFTTGDIRYQLNSQEVITLHYEKKLRSASGWIRGTSFVARPRYRLDMQLDDKKDFLQLPVKDVLNEGKISSADVGFFGYYLKNGVQVYFPVSTTSTFYKTVGSERTFITILSNVETSTIVYKTAEMVNGMCGTFSPETKLEGGFEKLEPVKIEIAKAKPGKEMCLDISVLSAGSKDNWMSKQFTILIP